MIVYGIKGGITQNKLASKGKPCVVVEGENKISIGLNNDPAIPIDTWEKYCENQSNIHSLPSIVGVPSKPVVCMWSPQIDYLFSKPAQITKEMVYLKGSNTIFGVGTEEGFQQFKEKSIQNVQSKSEGLENIKRGISTAIALFGKEPELIACWKLQKAFN